METTPWTRLRRRRRPRHFSVRGGVTHLRTGCAAGCAPSSRRSWRRSWRRALGRGRYVRGEDGARGWRNGRRGRQVIGTFGPGDRERAAGTARAGGRAGPRNGARRGCAATGDVNLTACGRAGRWLLGASGRDACGSPPLAERFEAVEPGGEGGSATSGRGRRGCGARRRPRRSAAALPASGSPASAARAFGAGHGCSRRGCSALCGRDARDPARPRAWPHRRRGSLSVTMRRGRQPCFLRSPTSRRRAARLSRRRCRISSSTIPC